MSDIQKAIDKLTALKDESNAGPWEPISQDEDDNWAHFNLNWGPVLDVDFNNSRDFADAKLIVTLHRTIDTQVAIMKSGLVSETFHSAAQMLAHAILEDE